VSVSFERRPPTSPETKEFELGVAGMTFSGLLAEPPRPEDSRALIVALHGAGVHSGYFDAQTAPGLSLLETGRLLGYTVLALDRPGIGASAGLPDERITLFAQAELLLDAIDEFSRTHPVGAGVLLVGHSYGLKVAWTMAAEQRGRDLLGVDGAGSGVRYAFDWSTHKSDRKRNRSADDRGDQWGPTALYPDNAIRTESVPHHPVPPVQSAEGERWPADIRAMANRIQVPLRLTLGEHERFWPIDDAHRLELCDLFKNAPHFTIEIEPFAGHNISLGWAARSYHLKILAFAEQCSLSRRLGDAVLPLPLTPLRHATQESSPITAEGS
jgi:pimeloyl-ACP methyl ester carboxylesterase